MGSNQAWEVMKIPKRMLSPTAVNTYLSCPRKYWLRYIKKLKTRPSIHLIRGSVVHNALCQFNRKAASKAIKGRPSEEQAELLRIFDLCWEQAREQLNTLGLDEHELAEFRGESKHMLANFITWRHEFQADAPGKAEYKLWSGGLGLMGIVDAVHNQNGKLTLVDYKTSRKAKVTADIFRQAAIYALLYQDKHGFPPEEIWIHFLKEEGPPKRIPVDEAMLDYAASLVESIHHSVSSGLEADYPCTCGGWCEKDFI